MIVCHCEHVSDREVHDACDRGARTREEVAALTCAGTNCGGCEPTIDELLIERARAAIRAVHDLAA